MDAREGLQESLTRMERDNRSMGATLAEYQRPNKGYSVLDGSAYVIAKCDADGSVIGYIAHELIDGQHRVGIVPANRASRWSYLECASMIETGELSVTAPYTLEVLHWSGAYSQQIAANALIIEALSAFFGKEQ